MISKIVLTSLIAMFLSGGIYTKVTEDCDKTAETSTTVTETTVNRDVTKAIIFNGEVIPMIELPVVAEGAETYEQITFLREQECDQVQGFYYSQAIPLQQLPRFVQEQRFKQREQILS